ncbi:MAG: hypothetical protein KME29_15820 [Calothrix sp. FI2-JRJ7]|nr:hypothetical protein [Calothrix sp. FI2-JRJ7]
MTTDQARVSTYIDQRLKELAEKVAIYQSRSLSNYIEHLVKLDVARAIKQGEIEENNGLIYRRLREPCGKCQSTGTGSLELR